MKSNQLEVLSVHTSNKCHNDCPFCYLDKSDLSKEKPHEWWLNFFGQLENIVQVALAWNQQPLEEICEYISITSAKSIVVNITCHPENITPESARALSKAGVTMVSISVDRHKCKNIHFIEQPIKILQQNNIKVGANLLMDNDIVLNLEVVVQAILKMGADMVYALHPKPDTLKVNKDVLKQQLLNCSFLYSKHFAVDECSKLIIGKSESCQRGSKLLSVNSKGELCLCSFDIGFQEFNGQLPLKKVNTPYCPFV